MTLRFPAAPRIAGRLCSRNGPAALSRAEASLRRRLRHIRRRLLRLPKTEGSAGADPDASAREKAAAPKSGGFELKARDQSLIIEFFVIDKFGVRAQVVGGNAQAVIGSQMAGRVEYGFGVVKAHVSGQLAGVHGPTALL